MEIQMIVCNHKSFLARYRALICTFIPSLSELSPPYFFSIFELGSISPISQNNFIFHLVYSILSVVSLLHVICDVIRVLRNLSCFLEGYLSLDPFTYVSGCNICIPQSISYSAIIYG
jgi:hypothetical protein